MIFAQHSAHSPPRSTQLIEQRFLSLLDPKPPMRQKLAAWFNPLPRSYTPHHVDVVTTSLCGELVSTIRCTEPASDYTFVVFNHLNEHSNFYKQMYSAYCRLAEVARMNMFVVHINSQAYLSNHQDRMAHLLAVYQELIVKYNFNANQLVILGFDLMTIDIIFFMKLLRQDESFLPHCAVLLEPDWDYPSNVQGLVNSKLQKYASDSIRCAVDVKHAFLEHELLNSNQLYLAQDWVGLPPIFAQYSGHNSSLEDSVPALYPVLKDVGNQGVIEVWHDTPFSFHRLHQEYSEANIALEHIAHFITTC